MWPIQMLFTADWAIQRTESGPGKAQVRKAPVQGLQGGSETVLATDKHNNVRSAVRDALSKCGRRVMEVSVSDDVVVLAGDEKGPINLVLADIRDEQIRHSVMTGPAPYQAVQAMLGRKRN